jgi:FkbM family methyltransferase
MNENRFLRAMGLPLLKALNRDISIRHHWVDRKIRLNMFVHKGYWYHGRHREAEEMKAIQAMISPGDTIVEVGGHIGYISLWFAECAGSKGRVTVFEPGSNNLPYIRQNLGAVEHVALIEKGCGSEPGLLAFFEDSLTGQNNSFVQSFEGLRSNMNAAPNVDVQIKTRNVEVVRLDTELGSVVPDFIKIDVEGFEFQVLHGANGWYGPNRKPPIIMIEVQADYAQIGDWMRERGYTLFDADGRKIDTIPHATTNLFALHPQYHEAHLLRWQQARN